jgi:predicted O-methyltransferase YrrM
MKPHAMTSAPETDPTLLYRYRDAVDAADMLFVGVHLDIFSHLAVQPSTKAELCDAFQIANRPTDVMLTLFTAMGLLESRDGVFHLTPTAREHLVKGSLWFLGPYYPKVEERSGSAALLQVLRTGKPASWGSQQRNWHAAMESEEFAASFTAAMDCRGLVLAQSVAGAVDLRSAQQLLDIGGGSGIYACVLAAHFPNLRATVLEKAPVDRIAARTIENRGLASRVSVVALDFLSASLPDGSDVHLFSNVLHDWDEPTVIELLTKSHAALEPGGMVVIHDAHLNAEKSGPLHVAEYSVLLVHASEGRCYSVAEMEQYLSAAGFGEFTFASGIAGRSIITARKLR